MGCSDGGALQAPRTLRLFCDAFLLGLRVLCQAGQDVVYATHMFTQTHRVAVRRLSREVAQQTRVQLSRR